MEALRFDLIQAIKQCNQPKREIIGTGVFCCAQELKFELDGMVNMALTDEEVNSVKKELSIHPNDSSIALTVHRPFYPPGKIIHIVRSHPKKEK